MRIICMIKSLLNLGIISGHDFIEEYSNKDIQVLKCEKCGYRSIAYLKENTNGKEN